MTGPVGRRWFTLLRRQWFLFALLATLAAGFGAGPWIAGPLSAAPSGLIVALVLLLTALGIDLRASLATPAAWLAAGLAIAINTLAAPLLAWGLSAGLSAELAPGLIVAGSVPCTLTSAAVWTRRGGGNEAIALVVTLATNLACFLVLPAWTTQLIGGSGQLIGNTGENPTPLRAQLFLTVVLPICIAQALRTIPALRPGVHRHRAPLSNAAQCGVLLMVLIGCAGASESLSRGSAQLGVAAGLGLLAVVGLMHLVLLVGGWLAAGLLGFSRPERVAVAIAGSQKTLAVGVGVAPAFGPLASLPMIAYHVVQLVLDTAAVDRLQHKPHPEASQPWHLQKWVIGGKLESSEKSSGPIRRFREDFQDRSEGS